MRTDSSSGMRAVRRWLMVLTKESLTRGRWIAAVLAVGAVVFVTTGCAVFSPQGRAEGEVRASLRSSVEGVPDLMWHLRRDLLADPEGTIADEGYIADLRPVLEDPTAPFPEGQYKLLAVTDSESEVSLTLVSLASVSSDHVLFSTGEASGMTCYTVHFPREREEMTLSGADCADESGRSLTTIFTGRPVIAFDSLGAKTTVDESDYVTPCQCSSGGDCDCPGG